MSSAKKILKRLDDIEGKLDQLLSKLSKLEKTESPKQTKHKEPTAKVGKVVITEYADSILITGDTFDIRNEFKLLGGKWDGDNKGWKINRSRIEDYSTFKQTLKTKTVSLNIKQGLKKTKGSKFRIKETTVNHLDNCMILDSSESDSE